MGFPVEAAISSLVGALAALCSSPSATAAEAVVRPALDGVFAAFETHPLVGLGDLHGLANEGEFYNSLVRDPRFAATVGNVVVEFGSSAHQDIIDRYLAGQDVPYGELRRVWSDTVGAAPTVTSVMYQTFFAQVRAVNQRLPPDRRIHVWLGEPAADWNKIRTTQDLEPFMDQRDAAPARIIAREILARGKKALVIYGTYHFFNDAPPNVAEPPPRLKDLVERNHPGAFYVIAPYIGFPKADCATTFEATTKWPRNSLVTTIKDTAVEAALLRPGCALPVPTPVGPSSIPAAELARWRERAQRISAGVDADALLYLAPSAELMVSPSDLTLLMDEAYFRETSRRMRIMTGRPMIWSDYAVTFSRPPKAFWAR
ncbi:hypothetical protein [Phenylobacterium sp.]|jgi:hypothetical protein|uniref:hypothetical protein n=1 Tax=Phenylobacterium sp. TaxID=1871053 RepID=UPI002F400E7C